MRLSLSSWPFPHRRERHCLRLGLPSVRSLFPLFFLSFVIAISADQSIPLLSECPAGDSPVFLLHHNTSVASGTVPLRSAPVPGGFLECTELCSVANDCVGVRYTQLAAGGGGQCQLVGPKSASEGVLAEFGDEMATRTVTKNCVKSERICSSPFHFDVHEQKILVGFAREVVSADSVHRCLSACLNAFDTFGFECESVMYYPVDAECILNTEDRLDRPDLFVDEHEDTVIYLDNNCAGSQCYAPYVTQYVAVEGRQLSDELDHSFEGLELSECEELCTQRLSVTANDFNCKSFMYSNLTRSCVLSDERSRPLGRANLAEVPGWTYFEKKCFASPRTCRGVPSFTRVPQMLLVGFASFVMENVPSVTMCLDQCTNPPPETGQNFVCKSVMYYYNEQECILNAESRHSKPDLFIPEEDDFVVDYFDINCRLESEQCSAGEGARSPKIVRTLNAALPEGDGAIHVVETVQANVRECAQKCAAHSPDKCRSFNFDKSSGICNLLYLDGRGSLRPEPKGQVDLYDLHCLETSPEGQSMGCVDPEGAAFSRHLYSQWVGGELSKELHSVPLSKCLNLCAGAGQRCEGLNYNRRNGTCAVIGQLGTVPGAMQKSEQVDFYRNVCALKEVQSEESSAANVPKSKALVSGTSEGKGAKEDKKVGLNERTNGALNKKPTIKTDGLRKGQTKGPIQTENEGTETDRESKAFGVPSSPKDKDQPQQASETKSVPESSGGNGFSVANNGPDPNQLPSPIQIPGSEVHTICNYEGISVQIKHSEPFSGVMFVKNKYDTCRVEVEAKDSVTLVLGLPANFGMKPITLTSPEGISHRRPKAHSQTAHSVDKTNGTSLEGTEQLESIPMEVEEKHRKKHKNRRQRRQSQRDCGLVDMDNGTYKTVVVVQTNNLGIPGLVTSMDQLYEISCNYSSMLGGKVTAAANLTLQGPQPSLIQPRGKIELGNPVLMQMMPMREVRSEDAAGKPSTTELREPLLQAKLGDILELRWELMAMDDELDFLVKDCYAEPGIVPPKGASAPKLAMEKLQLVQGGCPTPAVAQKLIPNPIKMLSSAVKVVHMQAFRFDSSPTVRLTCHLELCKGDCKAANCRMVDGTKESWGRKKRESAADEVTEFETRRFKVPRFAQATTSLTIVDPLRKVNEPVPTPFQAHSSLSKLSVNEIGISAANLTDLTSEPFAEENTDVDSELCMHKWTLGGVLGTLMALIVVQAAVVAKYMAKRMLGRARK
ncbi:hypothetical protein niasHT_009461 [Heterodera trifolii]|uniref:PAN domain-containing protein n=1 Tax=Heterodera trifolii TaxID=157864 RepID=A0ABD2MEH4_9BILA